MRVFYTYKEPCDKLAKYLAEHYIKEFGLFDNSKTTQELFLELFKPTLPEQVLYYKIMELKNESLCIRK